MTQPSTEAPIVSVEQVSLRFGSQPILRDVNLQVRRGQTLAVIGESGCGKTVLLKMIVGLIQPTNGYVFLEGKRLSKLSERELIALRLRIGLSLSGRRPFRQPERVRQRGVRVARDCTD